MMYLDSDGAAEELSIDEVAIVFSFLPYTDIMRARVCLTWREAAKKTLVPFTIFQVRSERSYNALRVMSTALPNLQQMSLLDLRGRHTYSSGNDADDDVWAAVTANYTTHDINIISNFRKLRELRIFEAPLNGRYHVLFDFPLLRVLRINECVNLKFDLDMLEGLPLLKELYCEYIVDLTGNVNSLRALRYTLERVEIIRSNIRGTFMDLADFPRLQKLDLYETAVTGDIRDISGSDFPALESICLPKTAAGGVGYEFQSISEVPSFMHAIHLLMQRKMVPFREVYFWRICRWSLSRNSPDWYVPPNDDLLRYIAAPPFSLQIIQAGKRLGWSWCTQDRDHSCEINWLDPVPSTESDDYGTYMEELQHIKQQRKFVFYRGYHQPPNEEEYDRLCDGL